VTEQPPTGVTELAAARTRKSAAPAINQDLRAWPKGMHTTAAAVELLIRGFGGRFAAPGNPWIQPREHVGHWADLEAIPGNIGAPSTGERAYLLITASIGLGGTDGPAINLSDTIPALGREQLTPRPSGHRPRQRQPPIQRHRNRPDHRNTEYHPARQPVPVARLIRQWPDAPQGDAYDLAVRLGRHVSPG